MSNCKTEQCPATYCIQQGFVLGSVRTFASLIDAYSNLAKANPRKKVSYKKVVEQLEDLREALIESESVNFPAIKDLDETMSQIHNHRMEGDCS